MDDKTKTNTPATTNTNGGLPADMASALMAGITASPLRNIGTGGKPFLRMDKGTGLFAYGPESLEVDPASEWAVNPVTFQHGWVCWVEGVKGAKPQKHEIMVSMAKPMPPEPEPINGKAYDPQGAFELRGLSGDDEGVEIVFVTNSKGGVQAVRAVTDAFQRHYPTDPAHPCPIVTMTSTHYPHPTWGKIHKPVFNVVGWCDMNGGRRPDDAQPALPPEPPAAMPPAAAPIPRKPAEPVATAQAHTGQRRRPVLQQ
jgi:hypothetical protein